MFISFVKFHLRYPRFFAKKKTFFNFFFAMTCIALHIVQCLNQMPLNSIDLSKYTKTSIDKVSQLLEQGQIDNVVKQNEFGLWKLNTNISENAFVDYNLRFAIDDLLTESKKSLSLEEIMHSLNIKEDRKQETEFMLVAGEHYGSWKHLDNKWETIYRSHHIKRLLLHFCENTPQTLDQIMSLMPASLSKQDILTELHIVPCYANSGWILGVWQNPNESLYMVKVYQLSNTPKKYTNIVEAITNNPLTLDQIRNIFPNVTDNELSLLDNVWKTKLEYKNKIDVYYLIPCDNNLESYEMDDKQEKESIHEEDHEEETKENYPCTCKEKQCSIFDVLKWELPWLGDESNVGPEMSLESLKEFFSNPNTNIQMARSARKAMNQL